DASIVERWWRSNPDFNVAIASGVPSAVFVVDVDGPDAEAALRKAEAEHGALPPTVEVITPRPGRHLYFRMPAGDIRCSTSRVEPKIDVRGTGGYVMAPPSIHETGRRYCWSVDSASTFADAPTWLVPWLRTLAKKGGSGNGA